MKYAVISLLGNAGKTTIAAQVLYPRLGAVKILSVESINTGAEGLGVDVEIFKGKNYSELSEQLMMVDNAIIDVGGSNVEEFLLLMQQQKGSYADFDCFVVPCIFERQDETIKTIRMLSRIGVEPHRIKIVFNKVPVGDAPENLFSSVLYAVTDNNLCTYDLDSGVIYLNEAYERVKHLKTTIHQVANDPTDFRSLVKSTTDLNEKRLMASRVITQGLALTANKNLDDVFTYLMA
jgi:hypothetical protein